MVVVVILTNYNHFAPLKHPYTARVIAEIFVSETPKHSKQT